VTTWNPALHPRIASGTPAGGQFGPGNAKLQDTKGQVTIGPPRTDWERDLCFKYGATQVLYDKRTNTFAGVYVDNETPDRDNVAKQLLAIIHARDINTKVVMSVYPSEADHKVPGVTVALEWYPYGMGYKDDPLPKADAYILQKDFAYPGKRPPNPQQQRQLMKKAKQRKPALIWTF
jgi:hypothetical protein